MAEAQARSANKVNITFSFKNICIVKLETCNMQKIMIRREVEDDDDHDDEDDKQSKR